VIGEVVVQPKPPFISTRLAYLASIASDRELLSEGQLCDLLAVDRLELRKAFVCRRTSELGYDRWCLKQVAKALQFGRMHVPRA
jgi:hypothetical protein